MEADDNSFQVPSWQVLLLLMASLGLFLRPSFKPILPPRSTPPADHDKTIPAYLWEDPLGEWVRIAEWNSDNPQVVPVKITGGGLSLPSPGRSDMKAMKQSGVCILPVVIRGDLRSATAREMRTRTRIAVLSGLGADGLVPDDPGHLQLLDLESETCANPSYGEPVPAEWFVRGGLPRAEPSPYGAVLVVWIRDDQLFVKPLERLKDIKRRIEAHFSKKWQEERRQQGASGDSDAPKVTLKVIGPLWSGIYVDLIRENARRASDQTYDDITLYSATSTMANGLLEYLANPPGQGSKGLPALRPVETAAQEGRGRIGFRKGDPKIINLTSTDEDLAEAFLSELELRGVDLNAKDTGIAIISAWDSDYSRVLPLTFAAKLNQRICVAKRPKLERDPQEYRTLKAGYYQQFEYDRQGSWPRQIIREYYLSGLDGSLSTRPDSKQGDAQGGSLVSGEQPQLTVRAEGEHQVDYIERLCDVFANRLIEQNSDSSGRIKIRAIGIFGADVYDKLLLIQALRPKFKDAIFFTDSIDARLWDEAARPYTRNVVIASPFALELSRDLQMGTPPFRSSEQTGVFLATQLAAGTTQESFPALSAEIRHPLRFEIGRTAPIQLRNPAASGDDMRSPANPRRFESNLYPNLETALPDKLAFWGDHLPAILFSILSLFFLTGTFVFVFLGRYRFNECRKIYKRWLITVAAAGMTVVVVMTPYDGMEPMAWIEGVSLWPSEILRLVAAGICLVGLGIAHRWSLKGRRKLENAYGLDGSGVSETTPPTCLSTLKGIVLQKAQELGSYLLDMNEPGYPARVVSITSLWRGYLEKSSLSRRLGRTCLMTMFFALGTVSLTPVFGIPRVPFRGDESKYFDLVIAFVSGISLAFLMFWVVDETHLCLRFVKKLGEDDPTDWPDRAYERIPQFRSPPEVRFAASAYLDVQFIGQLTEQAVPLILLPFFALTLVIWARWNYFANWPATEFLIAIFCINALICITVALLLRSASVDAKRRAIRNMAVKIANFRAANKNSVSNALEELRAEMEQTRDGAFQPWHQQSVVRAILLPFGGTGLLQIAEFFMSRP